MLKKILVVDDDPDFLVIVRYCLQGIEQLSARFASSGIEAITIAQEFLPDLILLDVMMPVMDGIQTLERIRQTSPIQNTPLILFTAKVTKSEMTEYEGLKIFGVITKPFDPLTLYE
ncbi:MAG: response regulator [Chlamydiae bacterium]|nr:response regulator [Chlamydiota bacterium]